MEHPDTDLFTIPTPLCDLSAALLDIARRQHIWLASAESCTGGRIGAALTAIPGSSDCYAGGVVAYKNSAKERLLNVPSELLAMHGAVSAPVARAMAEGARLALQADWAVATTGIAGPGGGSGEKPVGLVWIAIAGPSSTWDFKNIFTGDRNAVQSASVYQALRLLKRIINNEQNITCTLVQ